MARASASTKKKYGAILEPDGLEDGKFAGALTHRNRHGVARHQKQGEENDAPDDQDQEFDVAELFHPACGEGRFGFGFRFVGGVGELGVNGLGHADGVIRRVKLDGVPAHLALEPLGDALFKIVPLEPELRLVVLLALAMIDAVDIELPGAPPP